MNNRDIIDHSIPRAQYRDDGTKIRPACRSKHLGSQNRRILVERKVKRTVEVGGILVEREYEHSYHATKGWRVRSDPA